MKKTISLLCCMLSLLVAVAQTAAEGVGLIKQAYRCHEQGDDDLAVKYLEEALPMVEKFGPDYEAVLTFLGDIYMRRDDSANIHRILGLMDEHNRHELAKECSTPECHFDKAEYYLNTGNAAMAKDEYMAVFAMPLTDMQMAQACRRYAAFLSAQRDYARAGDYYAMSAEAWQKTGEPDQEVAWLRRQAGLCFFIGKEFDKAITAHEAVVDLVDRYGYNPEYKATSLQGLGNAWSAKKDYARAADYYRAWIRHLEQNGQNGEPDYAKAYERLASAEKFAGDYTAGIADYEKAIELYGRLKMYDEQENALSGLKMCRLYAGEPMGGEADNAAAGSQREEKLREIIRSSMNMLAAGGDYMGKLYTARILATIAGCHAQLGRYDKALDYYGQYIAALRPAIAEDFILKNPQERELSWQQDAANISQMNSLIADLPENTPELYSRLSSLVYEGQLLSKGILLTSDIEFEKVLKRYGTKDMLARYHAIKANLQLIEQMRQRHDAVEDILALERSTEAMQLQLARESAQFADFTGYLKISLADVAAALGPDEAAVEFVTIDSGFLPDYDMVVAAVVTRELPAGCLAPVGRVGDIRAIIKAGDRFSNDSHCSAIWYNIMQLAAGKTRLYFAPDGILNNLGIEYLTLGGEPLSDKIDMVRLSSTRELCREHLAVPLRYASLFGDIDYIEEGMPAGTVRASDGLSFSRLENTGREVRQIAALLKKHNKKTKIKSYTGPAASKAGFMEQQELPVNLIHIATHGKYFDEGKGSDSDAMQRSVLALAGANLYEGYVDNDGLVNASEIAGMTMYDCNLVVLSACESGLGKLGDDGVFGLQRGFKNAGVRSLLVSLSEVADASTADMMIAFYRHLSDGSGLSKREALRKAQKEIRAAYPGDDTWASFILIDSFN